MTWILLFVMMPRDVWARRDDATRDGAFGHCLNGLCKWDGWGRKILPDLNVLKYW